MSINIYNIAMNAITALKKDPPRFSVDASIRQWVVLAMMFIFLFVLPIQAVNWEMPSESMVTPNQIEQASVLGLSTDNSQYVMLPLINFRFDTTFQDAATVSFSIGTVIVIVALVLLYFVLKDYRKREYKYS